MKKLCCIIFFISPFLISFSQNKEIRLLVRGDDMGYSHSGNEALIRCYTEGIQRSIEVIVPSPWFPEAVKMLEQHPGADVGVHIDITSEWENIKWKPLSHCPSITDSNGYFYPMVFPNKAYPGQSIKENNWKIEDIEKEFRAQIETAKRRIPRVSHVSAHMGCTSLSTEVGVLLKKLAREYDVDIDPREYNAKEVTYAGPSKTSGQKIKSFLAMLEALVPGNTYTFVDHPGLDNEELRAIWLIGYEDVAQDRQGVTDVFTSAQVKEVIRKKGIRLISYKDLALEK